MPEHASAIFLQDLAIVLTTAALATVVFQRLRLPVVAGYLVAGILVGSERGPRLIADPEGIRTLAELGVVLLMASVGLEFRFSKLLRLGPRIGLTALVEIGGMMSLGLLAGRLLGWSPLDSLLAAGVVAISSTMVIAKVFDERGEGARLRDLVFGVLVMEDIVAIALIAIFTTLAFGGSLTAGSLAAVLGRLALLVAVMVPVGLLILPRLMRMVLTKHRPETVLLTAVGISFLLAFLTQTAGFSVALGAFVAGVLMSESGAGHEIGEIIRPVRDMFAAVFFVAVGMLLDVGGALAAWPVVLMFTVLVVAGKFLGVTTGAFLGGFGVPTAVRAGVSMAQIGEFSFIIAGLGASSLHSDAPLYPVAVATSLLTAFLTPILVSRSDAVASWVDRKLPHPIQTFASLYGAWVDALVGGRAGPRPRAGRLVRFLVLDTAAIGALIVVVSLATRPDANWMPRLGLPPTIEAGVLVAIGVVVALPFMFGLVLAVRRLARLLAAIVVPSVAPGKVDQGRAPRRVLVVALELALAVAIGLPLVAVSAPFLPPFGAPVLAAALVLILLVALWRTARDLDSHAQAGAELVAHVLARQGRQADAESFGVVRDMLPGLGVVVPLRVEDGSSAAGQTLGELNLRGRTGATVVALSRDQERRVFPKAGDRLAAGDLIAVTGSQEAIDRAAALMRATDTS